MANHKLVLDDDMGEEFLLIAIHCSEEAYKMGFLLNQQLSLRLKREDRDLDFSVNGLEASFPLFKFYDTNTYFTYHLVANKFTSVIAHTSSSGGLFSENIAEETTTVYLLPEEKKADYFLKISSERSLHNGRILTVAINEIKQVISAYVVASEKIKNKNNLIFD